MNNSTKIIITILIVLGIGAFFRSAVKPNYDSSDYDNSTYASDEEFSYDDGYDWAENDDIRDFSECDYQFGAGTYAEEGCNDYVQENTYDTSPTFNGYGCTEDCGGHEAGYAWAEENYITDTYDCDGNSDSFIEGCISYVEENY